MSSGKRLLSTGLLTACLITVCGLPAQAKAHTVQHRNILAANDAGMVDKSCDADVLLYNYRKPKKS